ncbi:MAG: maleylpyruvate isomerase family mycothiol-dependent enzyme [Nocardioides sp.]
MAAGVDHFAQIAAERRHLAARLRGLTPEQLSTQSLCGKWTVHDVIAHLVVPLVSTKWALAKAAVAGRGSFHGFNEALVRQQARRGAEELLDDLDRRASSKFTPPGHDSNAPLADIKLHSLDITVPLGLDLGRPAESWRPVLDFLVSPAADRGFVRRDRPELRLVATDADWGGGSGPQVDGPAAALAASLSGRGALDDQLSGPGLVALRTWQKRV